MRHVDVRSTVHYDDAFSAESFHWTGRTVDRNHFHSLDARGKIARCTQKQLNLHNEFNGSELTRNFGRIVDKP